MVFKEKSLAVQKTQRMPKKPAARGLEISLEKPQAWTASKDPSRLLFWRVGESAQGRGCHFRRWACGQGPGGWGRRF